MGAVFLLACRQHIDQALRAGDDDLRNPAGLAFLVLIFAAGDAAFDQKGRALADQLPDRIDGAAVDDDPMPLGGLSGLAVLAFPLLRGGQLNVAVLPPLCIVRISGSRPA